MDGDMALRGSTVRPSSLEVDLYRLTTSANDVLRALICGACLTVEERAELRAAATLLHNAVAVSSRKDA